MANPMKGEAVVKVSTGEFVLAFDLAACIALEAEFDGRPFQEILSGLTDPKAQSADLAKVIRVALLKHHNLSTEEVTRIVMVPELKNWGTAIGLAFNGGMPDRRGDPQPAPPAA